jgi:aspartate/methionine/tyrosine aminotransferase
MPTTAAERYQLSADKVQAAWGARHAGVLLASPSNPTGTSIAPRELRRIHEVVQARGGITMIDEIYLGLSYDDTFGHTALAIDDNIISINSFSKYFNMTGWRLGWMVVPDAMVPVVERLAQNLFICASTVSQARRAGLLRAESIAEYERRRAEFKAGATTSSRAATPGPAVPVMPDGAFYAWADCTARCEALGVQGQLGLCLRGDAPRPCGGDAGRDFGTADPQRFVRFSTANSMAQLQEPPWRACAGCWPERTMAFEFPDPHLLGGHRCRRHRVLRQLPEVL